MGKTGKKKDGPNLPPATVSPPIPAPVPMAKLLGFSDTGTMLRVGVRDASVGLAAGTVLTLSLASLSASGIIAMGAAIFELGAALAIGVLITLLSPLKALLRLAIISVLGAGLFAVGWYEERNFVPPITKKDIKEAVQDGSYAHPFDSAEKYPAGWMVFRHADFSDATVANLSVPQGAHVCFFDVRAHRSLGTNVEVRGK